MMNLFAIIIKQWLADRLRAVGHIFAKARCGIGRVFQRIRISPSRPAGISESDWAQLLKIIKLQSDHFESQLKTNNDVIAFSKAVDQRISQLNRRITNLEQKATVLQLWLSQDQNRKRQVDWYYLSQN